MTCFTTRGPRPERIARLASHHWSRTGRIVPPSSRYGDRWRALPVEGSKAYQTARKPILRRLLGF